MQNSDWSSVRGRHHRSFRLAYLRYDIQYKYAGQVHTFYPLLLSAYVPDQSTSSSVLSNALA